MLNFYSENKAVWGRHISLKWPDRINFKKQQRYFLVIISVDIILQSEMFGIAENKLSLKFTWSNTVKDYVMASTNIHLKDTSIILTACQLVFVAWDKVSHASQYNSEY